MSSRAEAQRKVVGQMDWTSQWGWRIVAARVLNERDVKS